MPSERICLQSLQKGDIQMPTKIGGGGQQQEYDSSDGRYGCGYSGFSHSYIISERNVAIFASVKEDKKTSKIMPNYRHAVTSDEKFYGYALNPEHPLGKNKAIVFKAVLGYGRENYLGLKNQIHQSIVSGKAILSKISKTDYGVNYSYIIEIVGPNGKHASVIAKYQISKSGGKPKFVTCYVK
jgi:hypothetical protein